MANDSNDDRDEVSVRAGRAKRSGGLHSLPVVGDVGARVRQFYDEVAPGESDSTQVRVAKEVFRWSSWVAGASALAVIVL